MQNVTVNVLAKKSSNSNNRRINSYDIAAQIGDSVAY